MLLNLGKICRQKNINKISKIVNMKMKLQCKGANQTNIGSN